MLSLENLFSLVHVVCAIFYLTITPKCEIITTTLKKITIINGAKLLLSLSNRPRPISIGLVSPPQGSSLNALFY